MNRERRMSVYPLFALIGRIDCPMALHRIVVGTIQTWLIPPGCAIFEARFREPTLVRPSRIILVASDQVDLTQEILHVVVDRYSAGS